MQPIPILYIKLEENEEVDMDDIAKYYGSFRPLWEHALIVCSDGTVLKNRYPEYADWLTNHTVSFQC